MFSRLLVVLLATGCAGLVGCTRSTATAVPISGDIATPAVLTTAPVDPVCFAFCSETIERLEAEAEAARQAELEAQRAAEEAAAAKAAAVVAAASAAETAARTPPAPIEYHPPLMIESPVFLPIPDGPFD